MSISFKPQEALDSARDFIVNALDVDGDGSVGIHDMIIMGVRVPGVKIDRAQFLQNELMKNYPQKVIDEAIQSTPMRANIDPNDIDKIADEVIKLERYGVSGISAALGIPGGPAMVATIPADIAQNYGFMLRAAQKLLYLYGFPQLDFSEQGQKLDSETMNILILCLGVMYGVSGAGTVINKLALMLSKGVEKKLVQMALTKTAFYPMVKRIASWFGVRMTKQIFANAAGKSIPVAGAIFGGGLTYATFKPCCNRLKASLKDTMLSNPNYVMTKDDENSIAEIYESEAFTIDEDDQEKRQ